VLAVLAASVTALAFSLTKTTDSTEPGLLAVRPTPDDLAQPEKPGSTDAAVHIPEKARQFIKVDTAAALSTGPAITVPARVAFRDGALAEISAPVPGRVVKTMVKVGDSVKAGDALLAIMSPSAAANRSDLTRADAELTAAKDLVARNDLLMQRGVGIEVDLLAAKKTLSEAQAEHDRAARTVTFLGKGDGDLVTVRSPVDGSVVDRHATIGTMVDPSGGAIVSVGDPHSLWVECEVYERDLPLIQLGASAEVQLGTVATSVPGHVSMIGSALRADSRRAPVYIELGSNDLPIRAGMFARATIQGVPSTAITLPAAAVLIKEDGTKSIFVQKVAGEYLRRDIEVGLSSGGQVQVTRGLSPGEKVVVAGALLIDGESEQLL